MGKTKLCYIAPLEDISGYAHCARDYVKALHKHTDFDIVTRAFQYDSGEYEMTDLEKSLRAKDAENVDIVLQHTTPDESKRIDGVFNVGYVAWETDRVSNVWAQQVNNNMDLLLVPCDANIEAFRRGGVQAPIEKIPHTFDIKKYEEANNLPPLNLPQLDNEKDFVFLCICQVTKKKALDLLLKSYLAEFTADEDVALFLKVYLKTTEVSYNDVVEVVKQVKQGLRQKSYPKIVLYPKLMDDEKIARLYKTCDSYALVSRGEGWSITHFDALGYGCVPIATNWAGPTEFIDDDCGFLVDYNMTPVFGMKHQYDYMYTGDERWAEPVILDVMNKMRDAYEMYNNDRDAWHTKISNGYERVKEFRYDIVGPMMHDTIMRYYSMWESYNNG